MRVVFLIYRMSDYRYCVPIIQEGLNRRYAVECWHAYGMPKTGVKAYTFPYVESIPDFKGNQRIKIKTFSDRKQLEDLLSQDQDVNVVFSVNSFQHVLPGKKLDQFTFKWATLMTGFDNYLELQKTPVPDKEEYRPIFFANSKLMLEKGKEYLQKFYPGQEAHLDPRYVRCPVTGTSENDAFGDIATEAEIREKYNIPSGKEILLYLPFPYSNLSKHSAWERAFYGLFTNTAKTKEQIYLHGQKRVFLDDFISKGWCLYKIIKDPAAKRSFFQGLNINALFRAVRNFCDKNNLYLVVKPRLKNPLADIVKEKADLIIWDDEKQQNPPILKELLKISRICMGYSSTAIRSAVFAGVFHINIQLPDIFYPDESSLFWYSHKEGWMFNMPGVCMDLTIKQVIEDLGEIPLGRLYSNAQARGEYIEKFIGFDDFHTSRRIFDTITSLNNDQ